MTHAPLAAVVLAAAFQPRLSAASARWASGQADGNVSLWQAKGEKPVAIQRLAHGAQPVDTLAYSEDGSVLVTIDARCTMRLWDADRGTLLHETAAARGTACETSARVAELRKAKAPMAGDNVSATTVPPVATPAVLPSGARIVARMTDAHAEILALAIAPDGRWLAAGGEDGAIHLWDMQTYRLVRTWSFESFDAARALAISPDSATLVASSRSGKFGHWHLADGGPQPQGPPSGQRTVEALAFIAPAVLALASNADGVRLWDFARSTYTTEPVAGLDRVSHLVALPDGRRVVAGRQTGPPAVFDSLTGRLLEDAEARDSSPLLAMDARGQALASSDGTGITLWTVSPVKRAERSFAMPGARVTSVALSPDAKVIAAGLGNGALRLWSVETGRVLADLTGGHDTTPIDALRFSPDGRTLVSGGGDHKVVVWSLTR